MATTWTKCIWLLETLRKLFWKMFVKIFAVTHHLHFSQYKTMETCFHINKSRHVKRSINTINEESDVINRCVKFKLTPLMSVEKKVLEKKNNVAIATNQIQLFRSNLKKHTGLFKKPSCKKKFKKSTVRQEKLPIFHFSHCKSMGTVSCHSNKIATTVNEQGQ